jgi:hypothetical protein
MTSMSQPQRTIPDDVLNQITENERIDIMEELREQVAETGHPSD